MSEKPLLLPSAKTELVLVKQKKSHRYLRAIFVVLGVAVVLYGAADLFSRVATLNLGEDANMNLFGPAIGAFPSKKDSVFVPLASTSAPLIPVKLDITSIGVHAPVESVGKDAKGAMKTPSQFGDVAWYSLGSKPGEAGNAVIAGHVNNALTKAGVFEHLSQVALGDEIVVSDSSGRSLRYVVRDIEDYPIDGAPADTIFSSQGPSQIVLVTCAGDWDPRVHSFDKRLVIFASLQH
jgi:LPXTG-site transpeptidase (sortase) family protein